MEVTEGITEGKGMTKIRKAVIPAAGYGTRMLPITKTLSKEMLPLVDKPIIQIVVEELIEAGIEDIIIVTAAHKTDLPDYFGEVEAGLTAHLQAAGPSKAAILQQLEQVKDMANFAFIEQRKLYGTGSPVLDAEPYLGGEPFVYTYADDFFIAKENSFKQMMSVYRQYGAPVLGCVSRAKDDDFDRYGYVGGEELDIGTVDMNRFIEKPGRAHAPSSLAALGFYIVTPELVQYLHRAHDQLPEGKEFYFTDAFNLMIDDGKRVIAKEIVDADYYDTGNKLEYMKTAVAMAARHPEIGADFQKFLYEFTTKETDRAD